VAERLFVTVQCGNDLLSSEHIGLLIILISFQAITWEPQSENNLSMVYHLHSDETNAYFWKLTL
jgi:hypothetical protein